MPPQSFAAWKCACGNDWPYHHAKKDDTIFDFFGLPGKIQNKTYEIILSSPVNNLAGTDHTPIRIDEGHIAPSIPRQPL
jgi:hypothetical protein